MGEESAATHTQWGAVDTRKMKKEGKSCGWVVWGKKGKRKGNKQSLTHGSRTLFW